LQGTSAAEFLAGGSVVSDVFGHAVSKSLSGIDSSGIRVVSAGDFTLILMMRLPTSDDSSAVVFKHLHQWLDRSVVNSTLEVSRATSAAPGTVPVNPLSAPKAPSDASFTIVCDVRYTITFDTKSAGYASAREGFEAVVQQMVAAVSSGSFDAHLHQYATLYDVPLLLNASTPDAPVGQLFTASFAAVPVEDSPSGTQAEGGSGASSQRTLFTALVALFVAATVLAIGVLYVRKNRSGRSGGGLFYSELALETDSMHSSAVESPLGHSHSGGSSGSSSDSRSGSRPSADGDVEGDEEEQRRDAVDSGDIELQNMPASASGGNAGTASDGSDTGTHSGRSGSRSDSNIASVQLDVVDVTVV
jgi:hypothetical protein